MCVQIKAQFENDKASTAEKELTVERLRLRLEGAHVKNEVTLSQDVITVKLACDPSQSFRKAFRSEVFAMYETYDAEDAWRYLDALKEQAVLGVIDRQTNVLACIGTCAAANSNGVLNYLNSEETKKKLPKDLAFYCGKPDPDNFSVSIYALRKAEKPPVDITMIRKAGAAESIYGSSYNTTLEFTKAHAKTFADLTEKNSGRAISMLLGDEVIYCPMVSGRIEGGKVDISARFSKVEAETLAMRINLSPPLRILIFEEKLIE